MWRLVLSALLGLFAYSFNEDISNTPFAQLTLRDLGRQLLVWLAVMGAVVSLLKSFEKDILWSFSKWTLRGVAEAALRTAAFFGALIGYYYMYSRAVERDKPSSHFWILGVVLVVWLCMAVFSSELTIPKKEPPPEGEKSNNDDRPK